LLETFGVLTLGTTISATLDIPLKKEPRDGTITRLTKRLRLSYACQAWQVSGSSIAAVTANPLSAWKACDKRPGSSSKYPSHLVHRNTGPL